MKLNIQLDLDEKYTLKTVKIIFQGSDAWEPIWYQGRKLVIYSADTFQIVICLYSNIPFGHLQLYMYVILHNPPLHFLFNINVYIWVSVCIGGC